MNDAHMDAKVLRRAAEIVEQGWCQHEYAFMNGAPLQVSAMEIERFLIADAVCLEGAFIRARYEITGERTMSAELGGLSLATVLGLAGGVAYRWNDAPGRTADEVAAALRAAADRCDGVSPEPA